MNSSFNLLAFVLRHGNANVFKRTRSSAWEQASMMAQSNLPVRVCKRRLSFQLFIALVPHTQQFHNAA